MKGGSASVVCKGYITKVVWRAILALTGGWAPHKLVILDNKWYLGLGPVFVKVLGEWRVSFRRFS